MKKIKIFHEELGEFAVALEALLGNVAMVIAAAILLRLATGKW